MKKIFFDKIIEEGKPTGFVDSDYDINELSESGGKDIISEDDSLESEEDEDNERQRSKMVESKTSILDRKNNQNKSNIKKSDMIYSKISEIEKHKLHTNNEDDYWDSEEDYDHDYLSEENDQMGSLDDEYRNEKKLNNDLTSNIQKNNRLVSGLSSFSNTSKDKSKSRFK